MATRTAPERLEALARRADAALVSRFPEKSPAQGGLALPRGWASLVTLGLLVAVLVISERRRAPEVVPSP